MQKKTILITGGAGFIGSHMNKMLLDANYHTLILDNLSTGSKKAVIGGDFFEGDLGDESILSKIFESHSISAVMHFSALIDVGESVVHPQDYYQNNVAQTLKLLEALKKYQVKSLIFSSTAAVYGPPNTIPIKETHPCNPVNPYGKSKLMIETILKDYQTAYGIQSVIFRYFNAAGGDPQEILKNWKEKDSNLIPKLLKSLKTKTPITVFGTDYATKDGTCIRDYIHVFDLCQAHMKGMEYLFNGFSSDQFNLGNGQGFSVKEVIQTAEKVTGKKAEINYGKRRLGDVPFLIADSEKAKQILGWKPNYPQLETIIEHAWKAL